MWRQTAGADRQRALCELLGRSAAEMNIRDALKIKEPVTGRFSDPLPYKEEGLDGKPVWPKTIDPMTGRPAIKPLASEHPDSRRYQPEESGE